MGRANKQETIEQVSMLLLLLLLSLLLLLFLFHNLMLWCCESQLVLVHSICTLNSYLFVENVACLATNVSSLFAPAPCTLNAQVSHTCRSVPENWIAN